MSKNTIAVTGTILIWIVAQAAGYFYGGKVAGGIAAAFIGFFSPLIFAAIKDSL